MLTNEQIVEIRQHLENAQNPVFFYDNDPDGMCSFVLLQKFIGRGKGVIIKSMPGLDASYFRKVEEFKADYVFVLDKPVIDQEFIDLVERANIPLVIIDHHNVPEVKTKYYYNTFYTSGKSEPVSYLSYKISGKKEDEWIAAIGCVTDSFIPDFMEKFKEEHEDLIDYKYKTAFDILYNTKLGKIAMILSFGIKDSTTNVVAISKFLISAKNAEDILEENAKTKVFLSRYEEINKKYKVILKKSEDHITKDMIFFGYSGDLSINQYVSNELFYRHPDKVIVTVYSKGSMANLSLRWKGDIRTATVNAIKDIEGATGGGHEHATGARMPTDKLPLFRENLEREILAQKK